jgi:amidophosphoribosyltransferase
VQGFRERLGEVLWREHPVEADVVVPVPDSSTAAAIGLAEAAGLPFRFGLIRSHYIGRTFIEPHQRIRNFRSRLKYNANRSLIRGQRIVIVDDSIVRGTTSRRIVRMLREAGAAEIHFRITSPPWRHPCYYGIDTPNTEDLIAHRMTPEEMAADFGCDSIGFLSIEGLLSVARDRQGWCLACFSGQYPTTEPVAVSKDELADDSGTIVRGGIPNDPGMAAMSAGESGGRNNS